MPRLGWTNSNRRKIGGKMNRRQFVIAGGAVVTLGPSLLMEGCSENPKVLLNTIIDSIEALLKVAEANAPWSATLQAALAALKTAEATWESGSSVQVVIDALNTVEEILDVIPETEVYAPLIAVLVSGIDAVLTLLVPANALPQVARRSVHYSGKITLRKPKFYQNKVSAYKAQWNELASSLNLTAAKI